nr:hypothetical protein [Tanacetum cinerariifolium]
MRDEHLNTILATESDEFIKSRVENLVPNPIIISSKIDSLFDEFTGELTLLKSIPPGIDEIDCHPEKEIRFAKRLFNPLMEEIDLSFNPDDPMPPGIEDDDNESERDIRMTQCRRALRKMMMTLKGIF